MTADSRIHSGRFSCLAINKPVFLEIRREIVAVHERDTVMKLMAARGRLEEVIASLAPGTKEKVTLGFSKSGSCDGLTTAIKRKVGLGHVENCGPPGREYDDHHMFAGSATK